jgi:spore germination cell wall hydrolase CwlJ-like protein
MLNIKKLSNKVLTILVITICGTIAYSAPSISKDVYVYTTKKEVSANYKKQVDCLAKNIYHEAAHESYEGKLAVAQVTMNRVVSPMYPKDICSVVYQRTTTPANTITCQFSWTCIVVPTTYDRYKWEESVIIAKRALTEPVLHDTIAQTNALFYHAVYVKPGWNKTKVVKQIGNHIFYTKI